MFWFALGAAALSAMSAKKSATAGNTQSLNGYTDSLKSVQAQNLAIQEANLANTIRTGYRVGIQQLQKGRMQKNAIEQGYDVSVQGQIALGDNLANAAASGTVGASVDAAADQIRKKADDAIIDVDQAYMEELLNSNLAIEQIVLQGKDALQSPVSVNNTMPKTVNANTQAIMAGVGTFASMYASSQLSLGQPQQNRIPADTAYRSVMGPLQSYSALQLSPTTGSRL